MSCNYDTLLSIYRNTPTIEGLLNAISDILKSCNKHVKCSIGWYVIEDIWVIHANGQQTYKKIHSAELATKSHPFHKMFLDIQNEQLDVKNEQLDDKCMVIIEVFIYKLATEDRLLREKTKHSHVISSICNTIKQPLSTILHSIKKNEQNMQQNMQQNVLRHTMTHLANGIFDILDLHKLETNTLVLEPIIFNTSDLISQIRSTVATFNVRSEVAINYYVDTSVPESIYVDARRLKQMIIGLMKNASQHTTKGEINLCIYASMVTDEENKRAANGQLYNINIEISDTGTGIEENIGENLFRPFDFRPPDLYKGTSLRICYLLAKKFSGDLTFTTQVDKGTCFNLVITAHEEPINMISTLAVLKGKRVLVVDNTTEKITICSVLDQNEMDFICANIYEEVFILYARKQFDLIIINMSMADGKHIYEQAKCIWAHSKYMAVCEKNQTVDVEFDCIINPHSDEESYKIKLWDIFRY